MKSNTTAYSLCSCSSLCDPGHWSLVKLVLPFLPNHRNSCQLGLHLQGLLGVARLHWLQHELREEASLSQLPHHHQGSILLCATHCVQDNVNMLYRCFLQNLLHRPACYFHPDLSRRKHLHPPESHCHCCRHLLASPLPLHASCSCSILQV